MLRNHKTTTLPLRFITSVAILSAIATVVMYFETPLPFFPPFLKMDLSIVVALAGGIILGPAAIVPIAFIKAGINALSTQSAGVGQLADFIITTAFAFPFAFVYNRHTKQNRNGVLLSGLVGTICIAVAGALANYYLLIPFFSRVIMPIESIISLCNKINPSITSINTYILFGAIPFNIIKGVLATLVLLVIYKPLRREQLRRKV